MKKDNKHLMVDGKEFKYFVYSPEELKDNMPAILFLHGIGERGDNLSDIEKYALPYCMNLINIPFIVIAPQCYSDNLWGYHLRDVEKVIDLEQKNYNFDKENLFICGYSMGAFGAWNYIIQRPELFRGIVSVAGGIPLSVDETINRVKDKPILLYHGEYDPIVSVDKSISAYGDLRRAGANDIQLIILPDANHFISNQVFSDQGLYDWLKVKTRKKTK